MERTCPVFGFGATAASTTARSCSGWPSRPTGTASTSSRCRTTRTSAAASTRTAAIGFVPGRTRRISGLANVSNLPTRPAPVLARTVTSLSALSGGRVVLGVGAGGLWDRIADVGVPRLRPDEAVRAFEEAIVLVENLSGVGRRSPSRAATTGRTRSSPLRWRLRPSGPARPASGSRSSPGRWWSTGRPVSCSSRPAPDAGSLARWAGEVVPAVREAVARVRGAAPLP